MEFLFLKYIKNDRDYIVNTNDLSVAPSTNAIKIGETIEQTLKSLEKIKQKNIEWYDRLYKQYPLKQYLDKKIYFQNMKFKIFKGYELKRFIRSKQC